MNPEAIDTGFIASLSLGRKHCWVDLEENVVERSAKVCSIDGVVTR